MSKSKKSRKIIVFASIGLVLIGLAGAAFFTKREVILSIQTQKVSRRNLTEYVVANGKIHPVLQVKISPEVSGEIIDLPVKEGQCVTKGDAIVKIKPDFYAASRNQAEAGYKSSLAGKATAEANLEKARAEFERSKGLFKQKLISDSVYDEVHASFAVATAQLTSAGHQVEMARANLASAEEQLAKTTIIAPLTGTISKLNSQLGERVLGTVQNVGTEIMTIADLNAMEARVDIGEADVVLIEGGQNVRLEVDAFKNRKFTGTVTEIANSAKGAAYGGNQQEATKFEVKIRIKEREAFRPGMSVTAEIETRSRTNSLAVPIASVTTRIPKEAKDKAGPPKAKAGEASLVAENADTNAPSRDKKAKEAPKPVEVVFIKTGDRAKMVPVKIGICDDDYWEIIEGLEEGQEVISGGYRAVSRDLEDGKRIRIGSAASEMGKKKSSDQEN
ncbi:MAG TPA: efflux RND transporter periplasmic adaptor subunit [Clostridia bacterium]|nr:efflux RND transporter periplasmic adaptor subunit [Clostridia bacterium]